MRSSENSPANDVVVTGMQVRTPLGNLKETINGLYSRRHAIAKIPLEITRDYTQFGVNLCARVKDGFGIDTNPLLGGYYSEQELGRMHPSTQYALDAAAGALLMAGIVGTTPPERNSRFPSAIEYHNLSKDPSQAVNPERVAICFATGVGPLDAAVRVQKRLDTPSPNGKRQKSRPRDANTLLSDTIASTIAQKFGIGGPVYIVTAACASGLASIGNGADMIRLGRADVVVVGGSEAQISPLGLGFFDGANAMDTNSDPEQAPRPFDEARDGFIMGEGAAALVLEEREHAEQRGAEVLATIAGHSMATDIKGQHPTAPSGDGLERAMREAMAMAALGDVQLGVEAHAPGTPLGDKREMEVIARVLRPDQVAAVHSSKGNTGHLLGASGALGVVVSVNFLRRGQIPQARNLVNPIETASGWNMGADNITDAPDMRAFLINALGFGGVNGTVILTR